MTRAQEIRAACREAAADARASSAKLLEQYQGSIRTIALSQEIEGRRAARRAPAPTTANDNEGGGDEAG